MNITAFTPLLGALADLPKKDISNLLSVLGGVNPSQLTSFLPLLASIPASQQATLVSSASRPGGAGGAQLRQTQARAHDSVRQWPLAQPLTRALTVCRSRCWASWT